MLTHKRVFLGQTIGRGAAVDPNRISLELQAPSTGRIRGSALRKARLHALCHWMRRAQIFDI